MTVEEMKLFYFKLRGRGEPIRLALEALGVEYADTALTDGLDFGAMKAAAGTPAWPFGQAPVFQDGDAIIAQSDAILRHIGRKYDLYGSGLTEQAFVDMVLLAVEDVRKAYIALIYQSQLAEDAKAAYYKLHIDPNTIHDRNGGAHFKFLENLLERNNGGKGFVVGNKLSIADIQLFDLVDLHLRAALYPTDMQRHYPLLVAHHQRIAAIPNIAKYLSSDRRQPKINGNDLG